MSAPFQTRSPHATPKLWLEAKGVGSVVARHPLYERAGAAAKVTGFTAKYDGPKQYETEHVGYCWLCQDHPARVSALYETMKEEGSL